MSFQDGWAAINLQMPRRVPRAEYSAESHWDLLTAVTGIRVGVDSPPEQKQRAQQAFMKAWSYDFCWNTLIGGGEMAQCHTDMGHAVYAAGGVDRRDTISCPFKDPEQVLCFDPWEVYGRKDQPELVRRFEEHYRGACQWYPDAVNMTGIYTTMVSGLIDIFGWDMLLLAAGVDSKRFGEMVNRYGSWIGQYYQALAKADVPMVMVHDDIVWTRGAFIHPSWYRQYVFPNYRKFLRPLRESGKRIAFTSDGNYTEFIDDVAPDVDGFVLEPLTDMAYIARRYGKTHFFIGNADTRILLSGTKPQIRAEVERCMTIGKGCPGFFLAVGNHIPANTPVESCLYYNQVYQELSRR